MRRLLAWARAHRDVLIVLAVIVGLWGANEVRADQEQAAQQRQGQMIEQRLCLSLGKLAALKPPAGNPAQNPSRAFDQQQHAILAGLGPDVGCPR